MGQKCHESTAQQAFDRRLSVDKDEVGGSKTIFEMNKQRKENILNQQFIANAPNEVWVGDITYVPTKHGFLYLAVFIDIFSRKVTGWAMDTRIRDSLVLSALNQAIGREHPEKGLIVHTDRGSQYISHGSMRF